MSALRAVGPDETPRKEDLPKTLSAAVDLDRRALLVRSRLEIAKVIDAGVPPHSLGRLISDLNGIDAEIRRLDASSEEEAEGAVSGDEEWSEEAI